MKPSTYTEWLSEIPDEERAYYEAIERYFGRRGGFPWIIRGRDWLLAAEWFQQGIPLHVIQRAIDEYFSKYGEEDAPRFLGYIEPFVKRAWKNYRSSLVGYMATQKNNELTDDVIRVWFENWTIALEKSAGRAEQKDWKETAGVLRKFKKSLNRIEKILDQKELSLAERLNTIEEKLDRLQKRLYREIRKSIPPAELERMEIEINDELKQRLHQPSGKSGLHRMIRERLKRRLNEQLQLPELSVLSFLSSRPS